MAMLGKPNYTNKTTNKIFVTKRTTNKIFVANKITNSRADKLIDCALFDKSTKIGTKVVWYATS